MSIRLSKNLYRHEFACQCGCGFDTVDWEMPGVLQGVVDYFQLLNPTMDVGIEITSGCRCYEYNKTIPGASSKSQHVWARGADFYLYDKNKGKRTRINPTQVADYLDSRYPNTYGIGWYNGRTHLDTRSVKARWDKR